MDELVPEAVKLAAYPNPQQQLVMFRFCFLQKVQHLQRTLVSSVGSPLHGFLVKFEQLKRMVFAEGILGIPLELLTDTAWLEATLLLQFNDSLSVGPAAFIAASAKALPLIRQVSPEMADKLEGIQAVWRVGDPRVAAMGKDSMQLAFWSSLSEYQSQVYDRLVRNADGLISTLSGMVILSNDFYSVVGVDGEVKLSTRSRQFILSKDVKVCKRDDLLRKKVGFSYQDIIRFRCNEDPNVGIRWALCNPSLYSSLVMDANPFRLALMMAFGIPLGRSSDKVILRKAVNRGGVEVGSHTAVVENPSGVVWGSDVLCCNCAGKVQYDGGAAHMGACAKCSTLCREDSAGVARLKSSGGRVKLHDGVASLMCFQARKLGLKSKYEEVTSVDPDSPGRGGRGAETHHADFSLGFPADGFDNVHPQLAVDVQGTHPFHGLITRFKSWDRERVVSDPVAPFKHLNDAAKRKCSNAMVQCVQNNFDFVPFIFDWFGGVHTDALRVIKAIAAGGSQSGFWANKSKGLFRFICLKLSVFIAKSKCLNVLDRVTDLRVEYARGQNRQGSVIAVAWVPKSKVSKDIDALRLSFAA